MAEIAERVWASIHTIAEIKEPAIPTAASASVGFKLMFPTMAVSVMDNKGSAIPEIMAGIASLLILPNEILEGVFKILDVYKAQNKTIKL